MSRKTGPAHRNKIVYLPSTGCHQALAREALLTEQIMADELEQSLFLWRCTQPTIVFPAGRKWIMNEQLSKWLTSRDWQYVSRKTGGSPVPQTAGMINISHLYLWPENTDFSIKKAYLKLTAALQLFMQGLNIETECHATHGAYCDGDYNINIKGQKVAGTALRLMVRNDGRKVVLAHACILVDDVIEQIVEPVNVCNKLNGMPADISESAHTSLNTHLTTVQTAESLFPRITQAFM